MTLTDLQFSVISTVQGFAPNPTKGRSPFDPDLWE